MEFLELGLSARSFEVCVGESVRVAKALSLTREGPGEENQSEIVPPTTASAVLSARSAAD